MENSVDAVHTEWLHGKLYEFVREKDNVKVAIAQAPPEDRLRRVADTGSSSAASWSGRPRTHDDWKIGHPLIFPNMLGLGNAGANWYEYRFQIRVPIDDTHTMHYWYHAYVPPPGVHAPQHLLEKRARLRRAVRRRARRVHPRLDPRARHHGLGHAGPDRRPHAAKRSARPTAASRCYRRMLLRELKRIEEGHDPKMTFRDPAQNETIEVPLERTKAHRGDGFENMFRRHQARYSPVAEDMVEALQQPRTAEPVRTGA